MAVDAKYPARRRRIIPVAPEGLQDSLDDVYRLRIKAIWQRLRQEPLHFWLFCGYLFFEYFRPQTIYPAIAILPWGRVFILAALLAVVLDRQSSKSIAGPLTFPVLGCFAVTFLSFAFAFDPMRSISQYDVLVNWILVYLLFLWIVNTKFRFFIVMLILLLASFKMAQHGFRVGFSRGFGFQRWGVGGPAGWFQNAADLGVQMAIYTAWIIAFYVGLRRYWKSRLLHALAIFAIIAPMGTALATGQRNTTLAFGAMALALVVVSRNRARNLALVLAVAAVGYSVSSDEFKARFEGMAEQGTGVTRLHYWQRGMDMYFQHPVLGVGHGNYTHYYAYHWPDEGFGRGGGFQVAHSVPVTVAAETGTLGLLFYYLVVATLFVTNVRSAKIFSGLDPPLWRYFALSLNYGLVGFLVAGLFLSIAFYPFLWFQAGLTASLYTIACRERSRMAVPDRYKSPPYRRRSRRESLA